MNLQASMEFLSSNKQQMLDLTVKLAEINSYTFNIAGIAKVAAVMKQEMSMLGCASATMPVAPYKVIANDGTTIEYPLGDVLRFWKRPHAPLQVLIVGHMDTVYEPEQKLTVSFGGSDILYGPGVTDMKGGLAVLLWALKAFEQLPQSEKIGWEVILNADEEIGSPGSAEIIAYRAKQHQVGFVFEPAMDTIGTLAAQRKGSGNFTLIVRGRAAHAGRNFSDGRNAVCKMAEIINVVNTLNKERSSLTINVGFIHGGGAVNVVPDCCVCKLNVRITNVADSEWVQEKLHCIIQQFSDSSDYNIELYGGFHRQPKEFDVVTAKLYSMVQSVGASIGQKICWQESGGCSDGNNLSAAGLPNVDTLGVRGGKIHSKQEFMMIQSLVDCAQLFTNILVYLSNNGFNNGK